MQKKFFILAFLTLAIITLPRPVHALANLPPSILPECDETRYKIQSKGDVGIVGPEGPALGQLNTLVSPEEYGEGKKYTPQEFNLVGYSTNRNCTLNDFLQLFVNLFNWMLYIISILGLAMLFVGGGTLLMSGGSEERVRSGKAIITNTVIGIAIALGSWLIINTVYVTLLPEGSTKNGIAILLDNQPWFRTAGSKGYATCFEPPQSLCKGGAGGEIVKAVQGILYDAGCYNNPGPRAEEVDGSYGPRTLAAWNLYQSVNSTNPTDTISGYEGYTIPCTILDNLPNIIN
ncbi:MAG: hypothetical protein AAB445_00990 [Patescibacteria group bacterium]